LFKITVPTYLIVVVLFQVLAEFLPLDNFRLLQPTPLAVLIFELPKAKTIRQSLLEAIEAKWTTPKAARRENFDLSQFMVEHRLEKGKCRPGIPNNYLE
jgi:hypothetical protein